MGDGRAVIQALQDSFSAGSRELFGRVLADDVVMYGTIGGLDEQRVMRGREEVLDYFAEIVDPWERLDVEFQQVVEGTDGRWVLLMLEIGSTPRTSVEIRSETAMVLRVEGDAIVEMRGYLDRDAALAAAGASAP